MLAEIARWERVAYFSGDAEARSDARDHLCVLRPRIARWTVESAAAVAESDDGGEE